MKKIHVCTACGSPRVWVDAYASLNDDEVRTFDQAYCEDCEDGDMTECSTQEVEVAVDMEHEGHA